jgi:hypothetical protein
LQIHNYKKNLTNKKEQKSKNYWLILEVTGQKRKALNSQFSYFTDYLPFVQNTVAQTLMFEEESIIIGMNKISAELWRIDLFIDGRTLVMSLFREMLDISRTSSLPVLCE